MRSGSFASTKQLTPAEEVDLVNWCKIMSEKVHAYELITPGIIRGTAFLMTGKRLGNDWAIPFIKLHCGYEFTQDGKQIDRRAGGRQSKPFFSVPWIDINKGMHPVAKSAPLIAPVRSRSATPVSPTPAIPINSTLLFNFDTVTAAQDEKRSKEELYSEIRYLTIQSQAMLKEFERIEARLTAIYKHFGVEEEEDPEEWEFTSGSEEEEYWDDVEAEEQMIQREMEPVVKPTELSRRDHTEVPKTFDKPLSRYRLKIDFVNIARALELPTEGTIATITTRIRAHLAEHPELSDNPRFAGLFVSRRA
jgi:hypothetical protein